MLNGLRIVSFMLVQKTIQMIGFITFLSAISISVVAAFYSIVGLMAIFTGVSLEIAVMGGVLEVGKLVISILVISELEK